MQVRSQVSMVFHLDKCIGCHTCSVACKNVWTDRKGTEYMWWNNVETKPGTGFPTKWEDQEKYKGGFETNGDGKLEIKSTSKTKIVPNIFHNPHMPSMDDYYEPWTYDYQNLFNAPEGSDQPTAEPISMIDGKKIDVQAGPNWDDDLGGSPIYAENDPNLEGLTEQQRLQLSSVERLVFFYLPRICNHCLNPCCVASCPSGALYKRGEDGIVLIDQKKCRAWRSCVAACPYKKTYFNWFTGKSEKCILCFPRLETGQAPACFHSCVGRIRYLGVLLYDAERLEEVAKLPDDELVEGQRSLILDPHDPHVIAEAKRNGISDGVIESAQNSPVYKFVMEWKIALPPHIEYRTLPMLFYVPPMSPVQASKPEDTITHNSENLFHDIDDSRVPMKFLANLFGAGHEGVVRYALAKQKAVRWHRRAETVGDIDRETADRMLREANCSREEADAIYELTSLCTFEDRFVIPPMHREQAIEMMKEPHEHREEVGFGFVALRGGVCNAPLVLCTRYRSEKKTRSRWSLERNYNFSTKGSLMAGPKTLRSLSCLLSYPDEQTVEAAELLYIILQGELPEAAKNMSDFGAFVEQHELWQVEEAFTGTFDVNPACALEVGWHLFGEEYARGLFLVRMREELRKYGLEESAELPDHISHVLAIVGEMPDDEAKRFVTACVLPAVKKMHAALQSKDTPYRHVVGCLALILNHVWGEGESLTDGSESEHPDSNAIPGGVDLLHAFPVADVNFGGCGSGCGSSEPRELVQLSANFPQERSEQ